MCAAFYYDKNDGSSVVLDAPFTEPMSLSSLPFDRRHYKKDSRFVNDLYTLTYDDHESLDSVRLFSTFANQVSVNFSVCESVFPIRYFLISSLIITITLN